MKMVTHFLYNTATATINRLYFLIIVFCNMFRHHTHCEIRTALSGEGTAAEQCRTTQDRGRGKGVSFCACWVFLCICNPLNTDMDYRIVIVCACCSACVHTSDLGLTSHLKDGVQSALVGARCLTKIVRLRRVAHPHILDLWQWKQAKRLCTELQT